MEQRELSITSRDGAKIIASLFSPSQAETDFIFIVLPAMGVKAAYYKPLAETLSAKGHHVLLCDLRGQGTSSEKPPTAKFGYRELLELDLPAVIKKIRHHFPQKRRIFIGHSLGGHLALLHAATRPEAVEAVAIIASGSVYFHAYKFPQNLRIWVGTQSSVLLSWIFGYFPGDKLGFGGRQPKGIMRDWARQGRTGKFAPKGSDLNYEKALSQMSLPVLACSIDKDEFAPHSATDHLISKLTSAAVTRIKYSPTQDFKDKIDHFRWVKSHAEIMERLCRWADQL